MPRTRIICALAVLAFGASPLGAQARSLPTERQQVDAIFARFNSTASPGCLVGVNREGAPVLRAAYGMADLERGVALRPDMIAEIGSVSKQFVAAALVLLEQEGRLRLDDPVSRHLPGFPDFADAGGPVTIRHLLQHTSGLRDQYGLLEIAGRPYGEVVHTNAEVVDLVSRQRTLNFPVNSAYLYSNSGYTVAAVLVERVSGMSLQAYTESRLFAPAGITRAQWRTDHRAVVPGRVVPYAWSAGRWELEEPFSNLHGAGGLRMTLDEMLRWTAALHARRIGADSTLATMARPARLRDGRLTEYGLGLMVREWLGLAEVAHSGSTAGYRAYLAHYPASGVSVAMQCNAGNGDYVELARAVAGVFHAQPPGAATMPPVQPQFRAAARPLTTAARLSLTGAWRDAETGGVAQLSATDSIVTIQFANSPVRRVLSVAADSLRGEGQLAVGLELDRRGRVVALRYHNGRVRNVRFTPVR